MKIYLTTLAFCVSAATAMAQLAPQPAADPDPDAAAADPGAPPPRAGGRMLGPLGLLAPQPNAMFQAIDADGDGELSKAEIGRAARQLRTLDADKDGKLTLAEVSPPGGPGGPPGPGGPFNDVAAMVDKVMVYDQNGDGSLSLDELPPDMAQQMMPMFQAGDKDGDGALSRAELRATMEVMKNQFGNGPPGWAGGPPGLAGGPAGTAARGAVDADKLMGQMLQNDADGDGQLSPQEVPKQQITFFRKGDRNKDGYIDESELRVVIRRSGKQLQASLARGDGKTRTGRGGDLDAEDVSDRDPANRGLRGDRDRR
jgi:Ca2+-binding EF-hand superfamily protein